MNLNASVWWMVELISWQELKLHNDTWHTFDEKESKTRKKGLLFTVCVITVYDTYNGPCFPFWQHTTELSFVFLSLPLGMHENNTITALKHGQTVCYTFVHFHLPTWADLLKNTGLSHSLISESDRGISEPCGVFNMEIGFEPHLHRSAHLWAKLCYCWQGKWTISSSLCGLIIILLTPTNLNLASFCTLWNL